MNVLQFGFAMGATATPFFVRGVTDVQSSAAPSGDGWRLVLLLYAAWCLLMLPFVYFTDFHDPHASRHSHTASGPAPAAAVSGMPISTPRRRLPQHMRPTAAAPTAAAVLDANGAIAVVPVAGETSAVITVKPSPALIPVSPAAAALPRLSIARATDSPAAPPAAVPGHALSDPIVLSPQKPGDAAPTPMQLQARFAHHLVRHRLYWLTILAMWFACGAQLSVGGWLFSLANEYGFTKNSATIINSLYWAGLMAGRLLNSQMAHIWATRATHTARVLGASTALCIVSPVLIVVTKDENMVMAFACVTGFLISGIYPLILALVIQSELFTDPSTESNALAVRPPLCLSHPFSPFLFF